MTEKHMVAAVIMRKMMIKAERIFENVPEQLNQFKQETEKEIYSLLDQILEVGWI